MTPQDQVVSGPAVVRAYVGLGSNLDTPRRHVERGFLDLDAIPGTRCVGQSRMYESDPMGPVSQASFINAVAALETGLEAAGLLAHLRRIERAHGRDSEGPRWGPRTLDLDLLLYGDARCNERTLTLPHPGMHERSFVLFPLLDIAPDLLVPGCGSVAVLAGRCEPYGIRCVT